MSGRIQLSGNDLPGYLAITQVVGSASVAVGYVPPNDTAEVTIDCGTISNSSWAAAPPDVEEDNSLTITVMAVLGATLLIACPVCCAILVRCWRRGKKDVDASNAKPHF